LSETLPAQNRRGDLLAAMTLFIVVNLGLLAVNGVRHGGDTPLYLDGASRILDGRPLIDREPSYAGYVLVVAAAQAIGIGTLGVVVLQVLLGAVAAAAVYLLGVALAGRVAGAIAATLYGIDVDTNRWHQFILADSIYVSLMTIGVLLTHRAAIRRDLEPVFSAFGVLIIAAFVRPEGWVLLPVAGCFVIVMRARTIRSSFGGVMTLCGAMAVVAALLAPSYQSNLRAVGPGNMLQRGQTIWEYDGWRVAMPPGDVTDRAEGAFEYALRHPVVTAKLMVARVGVHFAHVRPFYSTPHNVVIVVWLVPVYTAAAYAIWRLRRQPLTLWVLAAITTQTLVVAVTHAEWDGRYLAHVLPLIDTLVGAGIAIAIGYRAEGQPVYA
jgi:hypothetical protein